MRGARDTVWLARLHGEGVRGRDRRSESRLPAGFWASLHLYCYDRACQPSGHLMSKVLAFKNESEELNIASIKEKIDQEM